MSDVNINADKKNLLSSIDNNSDIELSVVEGGSNKERMDDSADPSVVHDMPYDNYHERPPLLVPADDSETMSIT